jgi:hypothetical protein
LEQQVFDIRLKLYFRSCFRKALSSEKGYKKVRVNFQMGFCAELN